jgi:arylsulfatase A-like enzyme
MNTTESTKRPNIIFIMSDDHTSQAIGSYNSRLKPYVISQNIDRIANEGAKLTNCFCTNSICTPSRACVLTGLHSHISGVKTLRDSLDPKLPTTATLLQKNGYKTAIFGKWHLHSQPQGFDTYSVLGGNGQGTYINPSFKDSRDDWDSPEREYQGYSADIITDHSLDWLKKSKEEPFALMCHFKATHEPFWPPERNYSLFEEVEFPEPEDLFWSESPKNTVGYSWPLETLGKRFLENPEKYPPPKLEADANDKVEFRKATYQKFIRDYLRTGAAIDENVGRILDFLDQNKLTDNTIVVYTSDQGYFLGEHNLFDKRFMLEESLRMPFLIRYPKAIKANTVIDDIVTNVDFAQTFLEYTGTQTTPAMQGRSFCSNLSGNTAGDWQQSMYYHYWEHSPTRPSHHGVRTKDYKLIFFEGLIKEGKKPEDCWELYNLKEDPFEYKNIISDPIYKDLIGELKNELQKLRNQFKVN